MLGHKNVQNTDLYTHLVDFKDDQYYSAVAKTMQEAQKLVEDGWEYLFDMDDVKMFRKPK